MKIIGLTGGIGSGKSTVARFLAEIGAVVINLDEVGHDVLKKGSVAYKKTIGEFGKGILDANGEINRARLGQIVFHDRKALQRLNEIVYPAIDKTVAEKTLEYSQKGVKVMVLEAAAMLEAEKAWQTDELWVTTADEKMVLSRLKERSGYSEKEAKARIRSQFTNGERIKKANVVINTDGTLKELKARVKTEWEKLLKRL